MKRHLEPSDIAEALRKQLVEGGAFDNHTWETAGVCIEEDGVHLLGNHTQLLVIFHNEQTFEVTVRERK